MITFIICAGIAILLISWLTVERTPELSFSYDSTNYAEIAHNALQSIKTNIDNDIEEIDSKYNIDVSKFVEKDVHKEAEVYHVEGFLAALR